MEQTGKTVHGETQEQPDQLARLAREARLECRGQLDSQDLPGRWDREDLRDLPE